MIPRSLLWPPYILGVEHRAIGFEQHQPRGNGLDCSHLRSQRNTYGSLSSAALHGLRAVDKDRGMRLGKHHAHRGMDAADSADRHTVAQTQNHISAGNLR